MKELMLLKEKDLLMSKDSFKLSGIIKELREKVSLKEEELRNMESFYCQNLDDLQKALQDSQSKQ
jgi:hypothetical protein